MSDERRTSVCGDPVEPAVADEPGVPGDDLYPHETSVEDHEGDEGPEDGPAPDADPTATILPGVPDVNDAECYSPYIIMTVNRDKEGIIDPSFICEKCGLTTVLQAKLPGADALDNYHITHESYDGENGTEVVCQMLVKCSAIKNGIIDDYLKSLPSKSLLFKK